jgi:probable F420-dependent oxidoreductase
MRIGILVRNMGPQSAPELLRACARRAEDAGLDDLWVVDHLAIPPDDAEGSGGRYLDPLATLAHLAGTTARIGLGVTVLIAPYRPPLPTAKWVATVQELSGGRLLLGLGVGWMEAEFRALGVERRRRGALTDELLAFLHDCFARDEVEANGQRFLFRPRPARPPFLIGGAAEHAFSRVVAHGDGWMPMDGRPEKLREPVLELRERMRAAGRPAPEVVPLTSLPFEDPGAARSRLAALGELGVTGVVHAAKYDTEDEFARQVDALVAAGEGLRT